MMKVYGGRGGTSLRAHWLLHELKAEYEHMPLDMMAQEHKKPEFLKLNPIGQVPVLVDGDFVLTESLAINNYLAEKLDPSLLGEGLENRAQVYQWSLWCTYTIGKFLSEVFVHKLYGTLSEEFTANAFEKLDMYFKILDERLAGRDYIVGKTFTVADINVAVAVSYGDSVGYDYHRFPNVSKWIKHLFARPAFVSAKS